MASLTSSNYCDIAKLASTTRVSLLSRSALQSVIGVRDVARRNNYYVDGLTHTWVSYYAARISSSMAAINEWHQMEDIESHRPVELKLVSMNDSSLWIFHFCQSV